MIAKVIFIFMVGAVFGFGLCDISKSYVKFKRRAEKRKMNKLAEDVRRECEMRMFMLTDHGLR